MSRVEDLLKSVESASLREVLTEPGKRTPRLLPSNKISRSCRRPSVDSADQLALAAVQLKRGKHRFYVVALALPEGVTRQLGIGLTAEDEDAVVCELHFGRTLRGAIALALDRLMEDDPRNRE